MRIDAKLGIVLAMRVHSRDHQRGAAVQFRYRGEDGLGTGGVQCTCRKDEINLRVDVEENRFHPALSRSASPAQRCIPQGTAAPYRTGCASRWAAASGSPSHSRAMPMLLAAALPGDPAGSPAATALSPPPHPERTRGTPTNTRSRRDPQTGRLASP